MKKEIISKIILIALLVSLLVISACSGLSGRRPACTGDHCRYYVGTQGIEMFLINPPRNLYYSSMDVGLADLNMAEVQVRVDNYGASDAYGAIFLSGISLSTFDLFRLDGLGKRPVDIPQTPRGCYLDIFGIGDVTDIGTWNFMANCFGGGISRYGDRTDINVNFRTLAEHIPGFQTVVDIGLSNVNLRLRDGEITQFSLGTDLGILNFGRSLMLLVSSLDFESFGGASFYLQGRTPANPGGEADYKTFQIQKVGPWPPGQDYYTLRYLLKSCYAYTTYVTPMICIDPDPFSAERKICNDYSVQTHGSQGAPVAVTNVRTENTGSDVFIEMTIRNVGGGEVWDVGYLEYCSPYFPGTVRDSMKNVIYVGYAILENRLLDCGNTFRMRIDPRTNEAILRCRYDLRDSGYIGSAYETALKLELWYGYEKYLTPPPITVRRTR